MFEAVELGRELDKADFKAAEPALRTRLLQAQWALQREGVPLVIILAGAEAAGRAKVADRLDKWLDTRGMTTAAFWDETDEERQRPAHWRFWRRLPGRGEIALFFDGWYRRPLQGGTLGELEGADLERALHRNADLERTLAAEGTLVVKFWLHLTAEQQSRRLAKRRKKEQKASQAARRARRHAATALEAEPEAHYAALRETAEQTIRATDTGESPWYLIEAGDGRHRDLTLGQTLAAAMESTIEARAEQGAAGPAPVPHPAPEPAGKAPSLLDSVDLGERLAEADYREQLKARQRELHELAWAAWDAGRSLVAVFEGWDAAGKGSAIRRVIAAMDARLHRVISVAAPTDEEAAHHHLWRFWRQIPRDGYATLYDRSWYGRVLVERVEGFAAEADWRRAYAEINRFEEQLVEHGTVVAKFWLHISDEEQLRRFREREETPWKQHKITDEDWRNRERRDDYRRAVEEMVARTSTREAPWTLIPAEDKKVARIRVLDTLIQALKQALAD
ncbi:polyphosphate:AMP phosphotransferase [Thiohalospira halophila DSM 15071]|uniref:Polyphosphate:AMP phosphotransferase n=1 Tax=Thiohalospira halophila DSM 15071 TaxID=1123397 RepID=A0A1I1P5F1_9GAMM|nr:polyphosphate:AMP phosphotransferase [Thiohalospira halophila]SFD04832.1 polyphosphate:AMP phosphotransferase [Thiohalospira halophila DSM 15071]